MQHSTQFKSAKRFLRRAYWLSAFLAFASGANAATTVYTDGIRQFVTGNNLYYALSTGTGTVDTLGNFDAITATSATSYITVRAISDKAWDTAGGTKVRAVALYAKSSSGTNFVAIPIKCTSDCHTGPTQAVDTYALGVSEDMFMMTLSFSLSKMCSVTTAATDLAGVCSGGAFVVPSATSTTTFQIKAVFAVGGTNDIPSVTDTASETSDVVSIATHISKPAMGSCPSSTALYFPGDGQIFLNPDAFSGTSPAGIPVQSVITLFKNGSKPTYSDGGYDVIDRSALTDHKKTVGGFQNTTSGGDNAYQMLAAVRDASGVLSSLSCFLPTVQTSAIMGFLKESNCFIASAAFRNTRALPVMWLREFRDRFLLKTNLGRYLVARYYQWSPQASIWLWNHQAYRVPVIIALIPFILVALAVIHPVFFFLGLLTMGYGFKMILRHVWRLRRSV